MMVLSEKVKPDFQQRLVYESTLRSFFGPQMLGIGNKKYPTDRKYWPLPHG